MRTPTLLSQPRKFFLERLQILDRFASLPITFFATNPKPRLSSLPSMRIWLKSTKTVTCLMILAKSSTSSTITEFATCLILRISAQTTFSALETQILTKIVISSHVLFKILEKKPKFWKKKSLVQYSRWLHIKILMRQSITLEMSKKNRLSSTILVSRIVLIRWRLRILLAPVHS